MAVFRCKICGGDLVVQEGGASCVCEYCGSRQTLPSVRDENLTALFNRANVLRMKCEFDKAAEIYEKIIQGNPEESEAYWELILCKYGIEYVEDPESRERIPTCHRASYDAVTADEDYRSAIRYADAERRQLYLKEAMRIDEIQRGIIALAQKESPYDVFICYKESDGGSRTQDSVIANDIYYQLTAQNLKVFYAAVTLEDKLGSEYEPVIFSALNSAKVMLVLGTKPEYFNAVWVKNEWSRFLKLMKKDRTRMLIPCYRDMDPYELPEEFSHLQAQDMGKIGFITDLVRGIRKVMTPETPAVASSVMAVPAAAEASPNNADALLKRGFMALEDEEYKEADAFFEQYLNQNPECGEAYWGKYLASQECASINRLADHMVGALTRTSPNAYLWLGEKTQQIMDEYEQNKFTFLEAFPADNAHIAEMAGRYAVPGFYNEENIRSAYAYDKRTFSSRVPFCLKKKQERLDEVRKNRIFIRAQKFACGELKTQLEQFLRDVEIRMDAVIAQEKQIDSAKIAELGQSYQSFLKQTDANVIQYSQKACADRENRYQQGMRRKKEKRFEEAKTIFSGLKPYKDSVQLENQCAGQIKLAIRRKARTKTILWCILAAIVVIALAVKLYFIPLSNYNQAAALMKSGSYEEAIKAFTALKGFKDSPAKIRECRENIKLIDYHSALALMNDGNYELALETFTALEDFKDSPENAEKCQEIINLEKYNAARALMDEGKYEEAINVFSALGSFKNSPALIETCQESIKPQQYNAAIALMKETKYLEAIDAFTVLDDYLDSSVKVMECEKFLMNNAQVSSHVFYGHYEQDNNKSNGKESIEWRVLAREGNRLLLMSEYGLDTKPYNNDYKNITWKSSTLRGWLNGEFYLNAFSTAERALLELTDVKALNNPDYGTNAGNDTQDRIFLLNVQEVKAYFTEKSDYPCKVTAYAKANGAFNDSGNGGTGYWWLRSPGKTGNTAVYGYTHGSIDVYGSDVNDEDVVIRPVIWLNLEADEESGNETDLSQQPSVQNTVITGEIRNALVGDHIYFGHYEQDNILNNGAEAIKWRVLAREENRLLLISEYGLEGKPYHDNQKEDISWEECTLRKWLNGEFYESAFSFEEQKQISLTDLKVDDSATVSSGNVIQDRIFLLNIKEAETYFKDEQDRQCKMTAIGEIYTDEHCYYGGTDSYKGTGCWWLRSTGRIHYDAASYVTAGGSIVNSGGYFSTHSVVARPVLWLNLDVD